MSGMYSGKNGIKANCTIDNKEELRHDIVCLTDVLSQEGYETAYVGKTHWHRTQALFDKEGSIGGNIIADSQTKKMPHYFYQNGLSF